MLEPVQVETDFGAQSPNSGSSTPGAFNPNVFSNPTDPADTATNASSATRTAGTAPPGPRTRWISGGGGLTVLNLEFNDAGPEGICHIARALTPRWCAGLPPGRVSPDSGRSSRHSPSTRSGSAPGLGLARQQQRVVAGCDALRLEAVLREGARRVSTRGRAELGWWIRRRVDQRRRSTRRRILGRQPRVAGSRRGRKPHG